MRCAARWLVILGVLLSSCQRTPTVETVIDDIVAGTAAQPTAARQAIDLASRDELVVIRRGLVDAILHLQGREFTAELHRLQLDPHPVIRLQAARAFERWGTTNDLDVLDKAAAIEEEGATPESAGATAANAALRLRLSTNPEPAQRALDDLRSDVAQVRANSAVNLGYYRWPPSIPALQHAVLNETDELVRAMAACALGGFDADAVAPVFDRLVSMLGMPPMVSRRCAAKAIAASDRPEVGALLARVVYEPDNLTRRWVIEGVRRLADVSRYKAVLFFASHRDADPAVRAEAVHAIAPLLDKTVESAWRMAANDAVPRVRAAALYELILAGQSDAVVLGLRDPAWEIRAASLIALTRRGTVANAQP